MKGIAGELKGPVLHRMRWNQVKGRVGTVFGTGTGTAVFDQNRRKPKPQFFTVRDTVFTRFLVKWLYGYARCPRVPFAGQMTYYRLTGSLSSLPSHSLTAYFSRLYVASAALPHPLKRLIACPIGLAIADEVCVIETVEQWTCLSVMCACANDFNVK